MWHYLSDLGKLYHEDPDTDVGFGWSGQRAGKNNPAMQNVPKVGPTPEGFYTVGKAYHHLRLGPVTMNLEPDDSNQMYGRDEFRVHGAAKVNPELSSEGCMILPESIRLMLDASQDRRLQVLTSEHAQPNHS